MLTRRDLFKTLGSFVVGSLLALGAKKIENLLPTTKDESTRLEINPNWEKAPYEIAFIFKSKRGKKLPSNCIEIASKYKAYRFDNDMNVVEPFRWELK